MSLWVSTTCYYSTVMCKNPRMVLFQAAVVEFKPRLTYEIVFFTIWAGFSVISLRVAPTLSLWERQGPLPWAEPMGYFSGNHYSAISANHRYSAYLESGSTHCHVYIHFALFSLSMIVFYSLFVSRQDLNGSVFWILDLRLRCWSSPLYQKSKMALNVFGKHSYTS